MLTESELEEISRKLEEIKQYDDSYWLRFLQERTIFDTENINAQKVWLIETLECLLKSHGGRVM